MSSLDDRLARARKLLHDGEQGASAARIILVKLAEEFPDHVEIQAEAAFVHDRLGEEATALLYYSQALRLGVMGLPNREDVYLGLGSSLRVLGRYEDAKAVLSKACGLFPDNAALKTFLAMVLYNLKDHAGAMAVLLGVVAGYDQNPDIVAYAGSIAFYADRLDEVWT
jgi:tetratricopeptide (TPR) repeat protein